MTAERLTAAHAMRTQGMTLIQIAATLGVGRSSLVRALAQAPEDPAGPVSADISSERTAIQVPEHVASPTQSEPRPPSAPALAPEILLLGRTTRRGGELEEVTWPAGYSPACPSCALPTTGVEEQYARISGQRDQVVVALGQPCGCLVDEHVAVLLAGAPSSSTTD